MTLFKRIKLILIQMLVGLDKMNLKWYCNILYEMLDIQSSTTFDAYISTYLFFTRIIGYFYSTSKTDERLSDLNHSPRRLLRLELTIQIHVHQLLKLP